MYITDLQGGYTRYPSRICQPVRLDTNESIERLRASGIWRARVKRNKWRLEISRDSFTAEKSRARRGRELAKLSERSKGLLFACPVWLEQISCYQKERKRERGVRHSRVPTPSLSLTLPLLQYQAETNLSWRITLAVSIYSDTRRISRERPPVQRYPLERCTTPAIHLRCMSPDVHTLGQVKIQRCETCLNRSDVAFPVLPCSLSVPLALGWPGCIVLDRLHRDFSPVSTRVHTYVWMCARVYLRCSIDVSKFDF